MKWQQCANWRHHIFKKCRVESSAHHELCWIPIQQTHQLKVMHCYVISWTPLLNQHSIPNQARITVISEEWRRTICCLPDRYQPWPIGILCDSMPIQVSRIWLAVSNPRVPGLRDPWECSFHFTHAWKELPAATYPVLSVSTDIMRNLQTELRLPERKTKLITHFCFETGHLHLYTII